MWPAPCRRALANIAIFVDLFAAVPSNNASAPAAAPAAPSGSGAAARRAAAVPGAALAAPPGAPGPPRGGPAGGRPAGAPAPSRRAGAGAGAIRGPGHHLRLLQEPAAADGRPGAPPPAPAANPPALVAFGQAAGWATTCQTVLGRAHHCFCVSRVWRRYPNACVCRHGHARLTPVCPAAPAGVAGVRAADAEGAEEGGRAGGGRDGHVGCVAPPARGAVSWHGWLEIALLLPCMHSPLRTARRMQARTVRGLCAAARLWSVDTGGRQLTWGKVKACARRSDPNLAGGSVCELERMPTPVQCGQCAHAPRSELHDAGGPGDGGGERRALDVRCGAHGLGVRRHRPHQVRAPRQRRSGVSYPSIAWALEMTDTPCSPGWPPASRALPPHSPAGC